MLRFKTVLLLVCGLGACGGQLEEDVSYEETGSTGRLQALEGRMVGQQSEHLVEQDFLACGGDAPAAPAHMTWDEVPTRDAVAHSQGSLGLTLESLSSAEANMAVKAQLIGAGQVRTWTVPFNGALNPGAKRQVRIDVQERIKSMGAMRPVTAQLLVTVEATLLDGSKATMNAEPLFLQADGEKGVRAYGKRAYREELQQGGFQDRGGTADPAQRAVIYGGRGLSERAVAEIDDNDPIDDAEG